MRTKKSREDKQKATDVAPAEVPDVATPTQEPKKRRGGFGRRKPPDPNAPPDPRSPPPRPADLELARAALQKQIGEAGSVAPGFGFGDETSKTRMTPAWRIYVIFKTPTVSEQTKLPEAFEGYEVARRVMHTVSPLWGKYKHP